MSKISKGFYSAKYFLKTTNIMKANKPNAIVTLQFFQRKDNTLLCGMKQVLELLKNESKFNKYKTTSLEDGTIINAKDVVLELEGKYEYFGIFEGIIDGILSRMTSLATNARNVVKAAKKKEVIFMGDRSDLYINQEWDGMAIAFGGIKTQVTQAQVANHDGISVGTIPHALIQMFEGNLIKALEAYNSTYPNEEITALVDFNNDVIHDSVAALKHFGKRLGAVRVDTSMALSDKYFNKKKFKEYGVTPNLIRALRKRLDECDGQHVKIIVSSGFTPEKIKEFEKEKCPVDYYGVGASLLKIDNTFTGDAVKIDGKLIAKTGRKYKDIKTKKSSK